MQFLLPAILSFTQKENDFFGVFTKELIGDLRLILTEDKPKNVFKKSIDFLKAGLQNLAQRVLCVPELTESSPDYLNQKNAITAAVNQFETWTTSKIKKFKKEAKDNAKVVKTKIICLFDKMTRKVYGMMLRKSHQSTANIIKFLSFSRDYYPFTKPQIKIFLEILNKILSTENQSKLFKNIF